MTFLPLLRGSKPVGKLLSHSIGERIASRSLSSQAGPSRLPLSFSGSTERRPLPRQSNYNLVQAIEQNARLGFRAISIRHLSTASLSADTNVIRDAEPVACREEDASKKASSSYTKPAVAYHLFFCAGLVYLIIVVGGLTRLTESGLSITEWNPGFKGMRLPIKDEEWEAEWEKYKRTPEWAILNQHMTVDDFKTIYMWEWSHRIIGRVIGVAFAVPAVYFLSRGYVARGSRWKLAAIGLGIGFQGALGWFMVQSGLKAPEQTPPAIAPQHPNSTVSTSSLNGMSLDGAVTTPSTGPSTSSDWHPRVSHFRLAAHLGTAFLVYLGMLHTGMAIVRDDRVVRGSGSAGGLSMNVEGNAKKLVIALMSDTRVARLRNVSRAMFLLTFATAMTGALVAGLDAGLVYSEFPYMGEGLVPPKDELLDPRYAPKDDKRKGQILLGNVTQNPVTVQLIHRAMAITTLASAVGLALYTRRVSRSMLRTAKLGHGVALPPSIPRWATLVAAAAVGQATLGISTLIYLVPIELASAHQAGSVALLSAVTALLASLRRPNSRILGLLAQRHSFSSSVAQAVNRQATIERALSKVAKARSS